MRKSLFIALAVIFSSCTNEDTISYLLNNNNETLQQDNTTNQNYQYDIYYFRVKK